MAPVSLVLLAATIVGMLLALLNIREKLWPKPPATTHPLEPALRDIAAAVRARDVSS